MTKRERVEAALDGRDFDCAPVSFWYHFGVQHGSGESFARTTLEFFRHYDLDYLKVMNDTFYPMPQGKREMKSREDLKAIGRFDIARSPWARQLEALDLIGRELRDRAYFVDTVFDPWQCLLRNMVGEHLDTLADEEPDAVLAALEIVTDNVLAYCRAALERGAAGIFLSTFASEKQMSRERYLKFCKPFVKRIFEETKDLAIMNTAHLHDYGIYLDDVLDIPFHTISYEDTYRPNPTIPEIRQRFGGTIMAGMDKNRVTRVTYAEAARNALAGVQAGGHTRFLLAPGCSFPTWMDPLAGRAIVEAVRRSAG
jgi:uroporphyrinogen decarboxylase